MVMEAVVYSTFRNHLKDYMKKVNDEFEPLTVVNKNPDEDIVVISKSEWDSLTRNPETSSRTRNCQIRSCGHGRSPSWSGSTPWDWGVTDVTQVYRRCLEGLLLLAKSGQKHWRNQYPYQRDPKGPICRIGKSEPLKYDFQGAWSRRIDAENRLIYMLDESGVAFLSLKIIIKSLKEDLLIVRIAI